MAACAGCSLFLSGKGAAVNDPQLTGRVVKNVDNSPPKRYGLVPYERPFLSLGEAIDVRIDQHDLTSVVFLCEDRKSDEQGRTRRPVATGFFVRVKAEDDPSTFFDYIVTARHVVRQERTDAPDGQNDTIYIRINRKNQDGFVDFPVEDRWEWPCHATADVAAFLPPGIPLPGGAEGLDYKSIPIEDFVGPGPDYSFDGQVAGFFGERGRVSVGDEIAALGLFKQDYGRERNLPVARFGKISRMPSVVNIRVGWTMASGEERMDVVAYLAEFLSWHGISGSPVLWYYPAPAERMHPAVRGKWRALLGIMSGHYLIREDVKIRDEELMVKLNSGIAFVTPAEAIKELLMSPGFVGERKKIAKRIKSVDKSSVEMDARDGG